MLVNGGHVHFDPASSSHPKRVITQTSLQSGESRLDFYQQDHEILLQRLICGGALCRKKERYQRFP